MLGTNRGITRYEPGTVAPVLRATRILGQRPFQPEQLSAGLNLEYPQNSLLFEVAAISSRTFPEQFQYENIRSRASLIEAEVDWSVRRDGGSMFTLRKEVGSRSGA